MHGQTYGANNQFPTTTINEENCMKKIRYEQKRT